MHRKEAAESSSRAGGRRPLLLIGNNRQMLNEIRDSLSHLRRHDVDGSDPLKPELSASSASLLLDKTYATSSTAASSGGKMSRKDNQHHKALAEIRDSLRPYQTAGGSSNGTTPSQSSPAAGGGVGGSSGACSDNSSTTSSASEPETNHAMVQAIMNDGFDEDIAVQALKLSGNQSVAAALSLLAYIMDERFGAKVNFSSHHKPLVGPSSPAPSETNSVRSDSPSQQGFAPHHRQHTYHPHHPHHQPHQHQHQLVNGQAPPPLPPRVPITTPPAVGSVAGHHMGNYHQAGVQSGSHDVGGGGVGGNKQAGSVSLQKPPNHHAPNSGFLQALGPKGQQQMTPSSMLAQSQLVGPNSQVVPQGHVQHLVSLMSPSEALLLQQKQQQQQQQQQQHQHQMNGGGGVQAHHRGVSPVPNAALIHHQMQNLILGVVSPSSPTPSSCPSPAPSSSSSLSGRAPPPYSQAQAQILPARGGLVGGGLAGDEYLHKKLVSSSAVSATRRPMGSSHMPVIMPSVSSKQVKKPVPQTATAPSGHAYLNGSPASPANGGGNIPLSAHHPPLNGLSQVHLPTSVAGLKPPSSSHALPSRGELPYHHHHHHHHHQHHQPHPQQQHQQGFSARTLAYPSPAELGTGQPTIHTVQAHHRHYTNTPPGHPLAAVRMTNGHGHHPATAFYHQASQFQPGGDRGVTPRSDSPVSRTTNQSPMSTISSPSTNSDIPDNPPPPYPGRSVVGAPLLPPRVPLRERPPPPPPPAELSTTFPLPPPTPTSSSTATAPAPPASSSTSSQPQPQVPLPPPHPGTASSSSSPSPSSPGLLLHPHPPHTEGACLQVPSETDETDTDTSSHASSKLSTTAATATATTASSSHPKSGNEKPHRCMSPLPERKSEARERDWLRRDTKVRIYSPQAFKFYMEQHVENILKSHSQRLNRRLQLEKEMAKVNLSEEAARQMRRMLHQKESNYIRLKRAKMESSMFEKITHLGVGAFGEVSLVRKRDVGSLYAMKTLKKTSVIKRNQVAHVKAERDILAEADNEWVVKLYYSFQDEDHLYFVMDYVPGGDLMGLLIRKEILEESLAQFYVAELVLAIESVHRMGFIHRDIKPDNILIDKDGHIKLTDFGLCTGFRWTHNSKYYQKDGSHARQDSMEVSANCQFDDECHCEILKPLERRRQREQKRCLAHSLVGTPNYIAPEVLRRLGYTKACDWWSVGVILYEMVIGQPPFYANTPAETQYKVINWEKTLTIHPGSNISADTADLILQLLQGPETRLGRNGAQEVKEHSFFRGIHLEGLRRQPAPLKPTIRYPTDTSNFDPVDLDKLRTDSDASKKVDSKLENGKHPEHAFFEFTFRRFFDDGGHPCSMPSSNPVDLDPNNSPVYV